MSARQQMNLSSYSSMIRGGRNPFKNMGSKLVERVRRSLSRSGRTSRDRTPEAPLAVNEDTTSPIDDEKPPVDGKVQNNFNFNASIFSLPPESLKSLKSLQMAWPNRRRKNRP
jgi:hypothetical protein